MKSFSYKINDPLGIHARPAGLLAKLAREYEGAVVTITKGDISAKATQLMKLMSLGIKQGDEVVVTVEGEAEEYAIEALRDFFEKNL